MKMTREMYESLQIKDLRGIAESRGLTVGTRPRKESLINKLMKLDEEDESAHADGGTVPEETKTAFINREAQDSSAASDSSFLHEKGADAFDNEGLQESAAASSSADTRRGLIMKDPSGTAQSRSGEGTPSSEQTDDAAASTVDPAPVPSPEFPEEENTAAASDPASEDNQPVPSEGAAAGSTSPAPKAQTSRNSGNSPVRKGNVQKKTVVRRVRRSPAPAAAADSSPVSAADTPAAMAPVPAETAAAGTDSAVGSPEISEPSSSAQGEQRPPRTGSNPSRRGGRPEQPLVHKNELNPELDSGEIAHGILEVMGDGFGFIRSNNYMPGENDVYVAPSQIRRFCLKTGDIVEGHIRVSNQNEKFSALLYVKSVNGLDPEEAKKRCNFEDMTPIFPNERIRLEKPGASVAMRVMDLMCPVGKGQRGLIVSPPKAGKTTLLKEVAKSVKLGNPNIHMIILLIDERPEEVTDLREALEGPNVEVIYSTFDELPDHHKRVAEMTIERAKRLVEQKEDVMILLDSITRLTRAYNLTEPSSGRTLSGGLDPVALHMPKRFFGAARNMREGGSLTILATALIETGSKMDDVVYEEFKGTGNMEMILNRKLSERRIFPAVDLAKSGTRRDDLLLTPEEQECVTTVRRAFIGARGEEATDSVLDLFLRTRSNAEFVAMVRKHMWTF